MGQFKIAGLRAVRAAGFLLGPLLLLACALLSAAAQAACIRNPDPTMARLQALVAQDARGALKQVQVLLDPLEPERVAADAHGDLRRSAARSRARIASLYAVQAEAYGILELDGDARTAASAGLKFAGGENDPVRLDLLSTYADSIYDEAGINATLANIEAARALQPRGSLADTCLLITRGLLEHRQDRADLAIVSLTQAYRASVAPTLTEPHILSAAVLSIVMRGMGDYAQALTLNQEKIDWDNAHEATLSLSVSRFMRGQILKLMRDYRAAIGEFEQSRRLSVQLDDTQGVAFADLRICEAHIELEELPAAQHECAGAMAIFAASKSASDVKEVQALTARIDLGLGRPEKALATLDAVLDRGGADMAPRQVAALYQARARANASLHNYVDAYGDLTQFVRRYTASNDAERSRQAGALRARFETDREIERNESLRRELTLAQERSQRQAEQLKWNAIIVVAGILVIALLVYILLANLSYRRRLVKLANQDGLTGLPNRRRTAELAMAALDSARATLRPLAIAIIDMDHFKSINDRCGHATGDRVLKEFARAGREALRDVDVLGRWGGEEFLLVSPEATIEVALANLERLRTRVCGIRLPACGAGLRVSLSAGVAAYDGSIKSLDELIARADTALYMAKNDGRDLVRVADGHVQAASTGVRRALRKLPVNSYS